MSGIRATFELLRPDEHEAKLTVAMSVGSWRRLHKQLASLDVNNSGWPASHLTDAIRELVNKADETLFVEHEVK